jgi:hypothetical protein
MFEITGAGGSATRMFVDVAKRIPPGPPDLRLVTAARTKSNPCNHHRLRGFFYRPTL